MNAHRREQNLENGSVERKRGKVVMKQKRQRQERLERIKSPLQENIGATLKEYKIRYGTLKPRILVAIGN